MSSHRIEIVNITEIEKHPNADSLGVVRVGGYTVCVALSDWTPRVPCLAAYIPPDSLVDTNRPDFSFLKAFLKPGDSPIYRTKVKKLRGIYSQGFLIPAPVGVSVGDDAADLLGVEHYNPPEQMVMGDAESYEPSVFVPKYDIENFNKFPDVFSVGEHIVATEKIHGTNARFVYSDGRYWCGSRTQWRKEGPNPYWIAFNQLKETTRIEKYLRDNPDTVIFGEIYGRVQNLRYGLPNGVAFRGFDILGDGAWYSFDYKEDTFALCEIDMVPTLYRGPFDEKLLRELAEGNSTIPGADNIREGIVIEPLVERQIHNLGRVKLKMVSNAYLEKS